VTERRQIAVLAGLSIGTLTCFGWLLFCPHRADCLNALAHVDTWLSVGTRIVLPAAAIVLVAQTVVHPSVEWLAAGLGASLFLFLAALAYPRGMGMGDVKLALLLGFALGRTVPVAMFAGALAALLPTAVLFARHGSVARKMAIPFAPFLAIGSILALFVGQPLLHAYLQLLN